MRPAYDDAGTQPDSGRFPLLHQADGVARLLEATGLNVLLGTSALSAASLCEFGWSVRVGKLLDSGLVSREEEVGTKMLNDSEALALGKALSLLVEQRGLGALVSGVGSSQAEPLDAREDVIGALGPDERLGIVVVDLDVSLRFGARQPKGSKSRAARSASRSTGRKIPHHDMAVPKVIPPRVVGGVLQTFPKKALINAFRDG